MTHAVGMGAAIVQAGLGAGGAEKIVNLLAHHRHGIGDTVELLPSTRQAQCWTLSEAKSFSEVVKFASRRLQGES